MIHDLPTMDAETLWRAAAFLVAAVALPPTWHLVRRLWGRRG